MESKSGLGCAADSVVINPQEQMFEQVYMSVQSEFGIEGLVNLVKYVTAKALQERENTLRNLETEAKEVRRAIDLINEVAPPIKLKSNPY